MSALAIMQNVPENEFLERMADAILEIIEKRGKCSILDLKGQGFSLDDIAHHWPEACELAEAKKRKAWYGRK